jgi:hypothetical protein
MDVATASNIQRQFAYRLIVAGSHVSEVAVFSKDL